MHAGVSAGFMQETHFGKCYMMATAAFKPIRLVNGGIVFNSAVSNVPIRCAAKIQGFTEPCALRLSRRSHRCDATCQVKEAYEAS